MGRKKIYEGELIKPSYRLPKELYEKTLNRAKEKNMSFNAYIIFLLEEDFIRAEVEAKIKR